MLKIAMNEPISFEKEWTDFRIFALKSHGDQKYGNYPYAYHLAMVENLLDEYGFCDNDYRAAAWLHDILEDTDVKLQDLNYFYGPKIAALVWACTGVGANRVERNKVIFERLAIYPEAAVIKIADRFANISFSYSDKIGQRDDNKLKMYLKEWPLFSEKMVPLLGSERRTLVLWNSLCDLVDRAKQELKV